MKNRAGIAQEEGEGEERGLLQNLKKQIISRTKLLLNEPAEGAIMKEVEVLFQFFTTTLEKEGY